MSRIDDPAIPLQAETRTRIFNELALWLADVSADALLAEPGAPEPNPVEIPE